MALLFKVCWAAPLAFFSFSLYPANSTSSFLIFSSNAVVRSSNLWLASPNDGAGAFAFLAPKMRRILFLVCWSLRLFGVYCGWHCCVSVVSPRAGRSCEISDLVSRRAVRRRRVLERVRRFLHWIASVLPLARDTKIAITRRRDSIQGYRCARPLKARTRACLHSSTAERLPRLQVAVRLQRASADGIARLEPLRTRS